MTLIKREEPRSSGLAPVEEHGVAPHTSSEQKFIAVVTDKEYTRLVDTAIAMGVREDDAPDVAQSTLLGVWRTVNRYDPEQITPRFLHAAVRRKAITHKVFRFHEAQRLGDWFRRRERVTVPRPDVLLKWKEQGEIMERELASMPARYREAWHLFHGLKLQPKEAAAMMKVRVGTYYGYLNQAGVKLQSALRRAGYESEVPTSRKLLPAKAGEK